MTVTEKMPATGGGEHPGTLTAESAAPKSGLDRQQSDDLPGRSSIARPLRVAHVIGTPKPGGVQRLVLDLVAAARRGSHPVDHSLCLFMIAEAGGLACEFAASIPESRFVPLVAPTPMFRPYRLSRRLRILRARGSLRFGLPRLLRRQEIDVVHVHLENGLPPVLASARRAGVPVVFTLHNSITELSPLAIAAIRRELNRLRPPVLLAAVSEPARTLAADLFRNGDSERVVVVRNGVEIRDPDQVRRRRREVRRELGLADEDLVIGTVARLVPQKRLERLVDAVAALHSAESVPVRLLIAGDGPERDLLERRVAQSGIGSLTSFVGTVPEGWAYMAALDVLVITSDYEGFPLALLEAAQAGITIVSTPVGGIPEFIEHDFTGLLVDAAQPKALIHQLRSVLADATLRERLGAAARSRFRDGWSIEATAAKYAELYRRAAARSVEPALERHG